MQVVAVEVLTLAKLQETEVRAVVAEVLAAHQEQQEQEVLTAALLAALTL
jgi:hypothetical protein